MFEWLLDVGNYFIQTESRQHPNILIQMLYANIGQVFSRVFVCVAIKTKPLLFKTFENFKRKQYSLSRQMTTPTQEKFDSNQQLLRSARSNKQILQFHNTSIEYIGHVINLIDRKTTLNHVTECGYGQAIDRRCTAQAQNFPIGFYSFKKV